jgi:hypothetical protein
MFVNISNHPSSKWSTAQRSAAEQLGGAIIDIPFPNIPATATRQEIAKLAKAMFADLVERYPTPGYAMVAGGGTLCSLLILALSILGWEVVFACSERNTVENDDGSKTVRFDFVQFR